MIVSPLSKDGGNGICGNGKIDLETEFSTGHIVQAQSASHLNSLERSEAVGSDNVTASVHGGGSVSAESYVLHADQWQLPSVTAAQKALQPNVAWSSQPSVNNNNETGNKCDVPAAASVRVNRKEKKSRKLKRRKRGQSKGNKFHADAISSSDDSLADTDDDDSSIETNSSSSSSSSSHSSSSDDDDDRIMKRRKAKKKNKTRQRQFDSRYAMPNPFIYYMPVPEIKKKKKKKKSRDWSHKNTEKHKKASPVVSSFTTVKHTSGGDEKGIVRSYRRFPHGATIDTIAAIKIQSAWRGFKAREQFASIYFPRYLERRQYGYALVDILVDELLQDDLLPEILIEIYRDTDYGCVTENELLSGLGPNETDLALLTLVEEFLGQDALPVMIREIVIDTNKDFVRSYFVDKLQHRKDPLIVIRDDLMDNCMETECTSVVRDCIRELVLEYLHDIKSRDWLEDFLIETLVPLVEATADLALLEARNDYLIDDIVESQIELFARIIAEDVLHEYQGSMKEKQMEHVSEIATKKIIDSLMLQRVLSHISSQAQYIIREDFSERIIDRMISNICLQHYFDIHNHRCCTMDNDVTADMHETLTADIVLDGLVKELTQQAQVDVYELHEHEKQREYNFSIDDKALVAASELMNDTILELRSWLADSATACDNKTE